MPILKNVLIITEIARPIDLCSDWLSRYSKRQTSANGHAASRQVTNYRASHIASFVDILITAQLTW
jgi:hypothetical protein